MPPPNGGRTPGRDFFLGLAVRQQTLILAGDDDPIIPVANALIMNRLLPNSSLHVYLDGHLWLVTEAADLAPRVTAFLRPPPHRPRST